MTRLARNLFQPLALLLCASAALAQTAADQNGDGAYSFEELKAADPTLTIQAFRDLDVDGNGTLDADEYQAGVEKGALAG